MNEKAFKFSVIIITDEDENKTRQTFDSILQQNCFDEKIQVIFFGRNNSVCEEAMTEYPDNVIFVDSEPEKTLLQALEKAEGKYALICKDGGYIKYKSTFKKVERLFRENKEQTDAVILKTYYESGKGDFLNYKFENDGHIIDLAEHPEYIHINLNSAFVYTKSLKRAISAVGESNGTIVLAKVFAKRQKYVVSEERCVLKSDSQGSVKNTESLLKSASEADKELWQLPYFRKMLVYELSRIADNSNLSKADQNKLLCEVKTVLKSIENSDISSFDRIDFTKRLSLLKVKNGELRAKKKLLSGKVADSCIYADRDIVGKSEDIPTVLYFVSAENGKITVEASCGSVCGLYKEAKAIAALDGKAVPVTENPNYFRRLDFLGEKIVEYTTFKIEINDSHIKDKASLKLGLNCDGIEVYPEKLSINATCLLENKYPNHYLYDNGYAFTCKGNEIFISPCDEQKRQELEDAFIADVANSKLPDKDELITLRREYFSKKDRISKPIWLISDRALRAGDNGEVFFEYVMKNHSSEVDAYFVLSEESEDYERLSAIGRVIEPFSYEHKLLFLLADKNISAQADFYITNPFDRSRRAVHDLMKSDFVFLQHGVTIHDISDWLCRYKKNIKGFVTASPYERNSITEGKGYCYDDETVWLTGLPRFDKLYDDNKKIITFMPTWRKYLIDDYDLSTGVREIGSSIMKSEYFNFYKSVVGNEKLLNTAEELGYTVAFLSHPNMSDSIKYFDFDERIKVFCNDKSYRELFAESSLIITDYSSAVFDFAYLRKPVIYCQFDKERFFSGEHRYVQGYFDYDRDSFGEVEYDADATVDRIIEYMQGGCRMKDKFISRVDTFFAFNDKENCKRIYDKIKTMK